MAVSRKVWSRVRMPLRRLRWRLRHPLVWRNPKHVKALRFWRARQEREGGCLRNEHYERLFLAMAGEASQDFLAGKVVADFGCGPRGSLCWARAARGRIGSDVLADEFVEFGIAERPMTYVCCTEKWIPLPSGYVDVLFTLNALDHVDRLATMCREMLRILAPGGDLIGSFNLGERPGFTEPQQLTEEILHRHLLRHLDILSYRISRKGPPGDSYRHCLAGTLAEEGTDEPCILWVRARKPTAAHAAE